MYINEHTCHHMFMYVCTIIHVLMNIYYLDFLKCIYNIGIKILEHKSLFTCLIFLRNEIAVHEDILFKDF